MKLMPASLKENLEGIKEKAKAIIESNKGSRVAFEEEPIAFGLKALIVSFEQNEEDGNLDPIENALNGIEDVNSAEVVDMRRAFG